MRSSFSYLASVVFFARSRDVQILRRVVIDLREDEVVVGVLRIVLDGALIDDGIGVLGISGDPGSEEEPPRVINQSPAGDQHDCDRDDLSRPRVDLNFPVADQRVAMGTHFKSGAGPMYSARGRIKRLLEYCSRIWAVQPDMRLTAKNGVNRSIGIPLTKYVLAE